MIKQIKIDYFFSFSQSKQTICLNQACNILIGINGTGKSNFIRAIQLLYEGVIGQGLEKILNQWGGFSNMIHYETTPIDTITIAYEFDKELVTHFTDNNGHRFLQNPIYEIKIHKLGLTGYYLSEWLYHQNSDNSTFTYLKISNGKGVIATKRGKTIPIRARTFKEQEFGLRQISEPNEYYPLYTLKKSIETIAIYHHFDTSFNGVIRQLSSFYTELKLLANGENLTYLLNYLNGNHTLMYDKIINLLSNTLNSNFRDLVFSQPTAGKTLLSLREHQLNRAISIEHISDGTLRFLLMLSIFYNPNRGKIICLDEPETGLHPDMIRTIGEAIKFAAKNGTQIIIATHSPLLLNAFELENLLIFEKNEQNATIISTKSEEDFENWESDFLVGQMWLSGQIGGVRW
ncbi:MAG: hypothetical protein RLZZ628_4482 [Bacteroidota bacterium]|jgi:predicted ATPase